jgi:hypothetical protein
MDNDPKADSRLQTDRLNAPSDRPETITIPRLTLDQESYIRAIWKATGKYDRDAMISGSRPRGNTFL